MTSTAQMALPRPRLIQWDAEHDEPYLVLPNHPDIRLTPWRRADDDAAVEMSNDPEVGKYALRRPYPYLPEHRTFVWDVLDPGAQRSIACLRAMLSQPLGDGIVGPSDTSPDNGPNGHGADTISIASVLPFPFGAIRHHPTGTLVGDIGFFQDRLAPGADQQQDDDSDKAFAGALPQGVPPRQQAWELGYNVCRGWRGKGVGKGAVKAVVDGWARYMGIGTVVAQIETRNVASAAVVRSLGFQPVRTYMQEWPADKGGGERELVRWELSLT